MTKRLELPGQNTVSVDIGGQRYNSRTGYVDIDRPEHIAIAEKTGLRFVGPQTSFQGAPEKIHECGFAQFAQMAVGTCPKCGGTWQA